MQVTIIDPPSGWKYGFPTGPQQTQPPVTGRVACRERIPKRGCKVG